MWLWFIFTRTESDDKMESDLFHDFSDWFTAEFTDCQESALLLKSLFKRAWVRSAQTYLRC